MTTMLKQLNIHNLRPGLDSRFNGCREELGLVVLASHSADNQIETSARYFDWQPGCFNQTRPVTFSRVISR